MRDDLKTYSRYWLSKEYVLIDPTGGPDPANAVIFNQLTWTFVLIEDSLADNAIKREMHAKGIPILKEPIGENLIEKATDAMLASGISIEEVNRKRRRLLEELRKQFNIMRKGNADECH